MVATLAFIAVALPVPAYPAWATLTSLGTGLLLVGGFIGVRRPRERLGRILIATGLLAAVTNATGEYATYSALGRAGHLFATSSVAWVSSMTQVAMLLGGIAILMLFPTGRLLSPRWRPVAWTVAVGSL